MQQTTLGDEPAEPFDLATGEAIGSDDRAVGQVEQRGGADQIVTRI